MLGRGCLWSGAVDRPASWQAQATPQGAALPAKSLRWETPCGTLGLGIPIEQGAVGLVVAKGPLGLSPCTGVWCGHRAVSWLTCQRTRKHMVSCMRAFPRAAHLPQDLTWGHPAWPALAWPGGGACCLGSPVILSHFAASGAPWRPEAASPLTDTGTVVPSALDLLRTAGPLSPSAPRVGSKRPWGKLAPHLALKFPQGPEIVLAHPLRTSPARSGPSWTMAQPIVAPRFKAGGPPRAGLQPWLP